jgi:surface antigen
MIGDGGKDQSMNRKSLIASACFALALAGCAAEPWGPRQTSGAVIGGVAGGLLGNTVGHGSGKVLATALGASIGALVGSEIGRSLDEADRERMYYAADRSLRSGAPEDWANEANGHRGMFEPGPIYHRKAEVCRNFTHTIWIKGRPEVARGTACQLPDGSWHIVS